MTKLILIRHGESEANREHYFAGQYDAELMPRGREQAEMTAEYVFRKYSPEKIYASDLSRAYSTAEPISRLINAEIIKEPGLREIFAGRWQKMTFNDLEKEFPEEYGIWKTDIGNAKCPEGETVKELGERIMKTLEKIAKENPQKTIAIATHATPIRVAETIIEHGDIEYMKDVAWVSNGSVTVLEYDGDWKVLSVSEDEHLGDERTVFPANV